MANAPDNRSPPPTAFGFSDTYAISPPSPPRFYSSPPPSSPTVYSSSSSSSSSTSSTPTTYPTFLRHFFQTIHPPSTLPPQCHRHAYPTWRRKTSTQHSKPSDPPRPSPPAKLSLADCLHVGALVKGFQPYRNERVWCESDFAPSPPKRLRGVAVRGGQQRKREGEEVDRAFEQLMEARVALMANRIARAKGIARAAGRHRSSEPEREPGLASPERDAYFASPGPVYPYPSHLERGILALLESSEEEGEVSASSTLLSSSSGSTVALPPTMPDMTGHHWEPTAFQFLPADSYPKRSELPRVQTTSLLTAAIERGQGGSSAAGALRAEVGMEVTAEELPSVFSWSSDEDSEYEEDGDEVEGE